MVFKHDDKVHFHLVKEAVKMCLIKNIGQEAGKVIPVTKPMPGDQILKVAC